MRPSLVYGFCTLFYSKSGLYFSQEKRIDKENRSEVDILLQTTRTGKMLRGQKRTKE